MFSQLFGRYLEEKGKLNHTQLHDVLEAAAKTHVKMGTIAVAGNYMTVEQVNEVYALQSKEDRMFGQIAFEKGYLTLKQIDEILDKQGSCAMQFLQLLSEKGYLTLDEVNDYLERFALEKGCTPEEMETLKSDDIDGIIPVFAFSSRPYVMEIIGLIMRNMIRFVSTDFYFKRLTKVSGYEYSLLIGQHMKGDHDIYIGFGAPKRDFSGLRALAASYSGEEVMDMSDDTIGTCAEFANLCNGIFASEMSDKGVNLELYPPFTYKEQCVRGISYVLPIVINGAKLDIYIAIDEDIVLGRKPYSIKTAVELGDIEEDNPELHTGRTVLIVDDSAFVRKMIRVILEKEGYEIVGEAGDGAQAVYEYRLLHPDIVTMDLIMPGKDGVEATEEIIGINPDARIVMITASGMQSKIDESLNAGAKTFLTKPFTPEALAGAIRKI